MVKKRKRKYFLLFLLFIPYNGIGEGMKEIKKLRFYFLVFVILLSIYSIKVMGIVKKEVNTIYIDPGHGGVDGGAIARNEVYEKDINLAISFALKEVLETSGYQVKMTRTGDYDLASIDAKNRKTEDIHERVKRINESNCLLYISIHSNIYSSNQIHGAQTFYSSSNDQSKQLAIFIQNNLRDILKNTTREAKSITGKYLIDHTQKVGCLVEVGFLSHPEELKQLMNPVYQEKVAMSIFSGILEYLES